MRLSTRAGGSDTLAADSHPASMSSVAFTDWVAPHWDVLRMIAERTAGPADRDDAMQEALVSAWLHRDQFDAQRGSARGWLAAITINAARRLARQRAGMLARTPPMLVTDTYWDDSHAYALDIEQAVEKLPKRQRLAITLYYFIGLSTADTAIAMGCAQGTVKATLAAARATLKTTLGNS